jgi:hypothetical protein
MVARMLTITATLARTYLQTHSGIVVETLSRIVPGIGILLLMKTEIHITHRVIVSMYTPALDAHAQIRHMLIVWDTAVG